MSTWLLDRLLEKLWPLGWQALVFFAALVVGLLMCKRYYGACLYRMAQMLWRRALDWLESAQLTLRIPEGWLTWPVLLPAVAVALLAVTVWETARRVTGRPSTYAVGVGMISLVLLACAALACPSVSTDSESRSRRIWTVCVVTAYAVALLVLRWTCLLINDTMQSALWCSLSAISLFLLYWWLRPRIRQMTPDWQRRELAVGRPLWQLLRRWPIVVLMASAAGLLLLWVGRTDVRLDPATQTLLYRRDKGTANCTFASRGESGAYLAEIMVRDRTGGETASDIWLLNTHGRSEKALVEGGGENRRPVFSPDGKSVAYYNRDVEGQRPQDQEYVVRIVSVESGDITDIDSGVAPSWRPDGKAIVYSKRVGHGARLSDETWNLFVACPDQPWCQPVRLTNGNCRDFAPSWGTKNDLIVFSRSWQKPSSDPDGFYTVSPPKRRSAETSPDVHFYAAVAPWVTSPETSPEVSLLLSQSRDRVRFRPVWSPDCSCLAYHMQTGAPRPSLYAIEVFRNGYTKKWQVKRGTERMVAQAGEGPSWNPTSKRRQLLFSALTEGGHHIWSRDVPRIDEF